MKKNKICWEIFFTGKRKAKIPVAKINKTFPIKIFPGMFFIFHRLTILCFIFSKNEYIYGNFSKTFCGRYLRFWGRGQCIA